MSRDPHSVEYLDDCHHSSHEEIVQLPHAIVTEGVCFHPAWKFQGAIEEYRPGDMRVCIMLAGTRDSGLYLGLTPDGARNYAAALIKMASMVDAQIAQQAAAAIEAARQNGNS